MNDFKCTAAVAGVQEGRAEAKVEHCAIYVTSRPFSLASRFSGSRFHL